MKRKSKRDKKISIRRKRNAAKARIQKAASDLRLTERLALKKQRHAEHMEFVRVKKLRVNGNPL